MKLVLFKTLLALCLGMLSTGESNALQFQAGLGAKTSTEIDYYHHELTAANTGTGALHTLRMMESCLIRI